MGLRKKDARFFDAFARHARTTLEAARLVRSMFDDTRLECCGAIGALEDPADDVYQRAIATLFKAPEDPLLVLKWRDIYDALENATDRCADVANNIEGITPRRGLRTRLTVRRERDNLGGVRGFEG